MAGRWVRRGRRARLRVRLERVQHVLRRERRGRGRRRGEAGEGVVTMTASACLVDASSSFASFRRPACARRRPRGGDDFASARARRRRRRPRRRRRHRRDAALARRPRRPIRHLRRLRVRASLGGRLIRCVRDVVRPRALFRAFLGDLPGRSGARAPSARARRVSVAPPPPLPLRRAGGRRRRRRQARFPAVSFCARSALSRFATRAAVRRATRRAFIASGSRPTTLSHPQDGIERGRFRVSQRGLLEPTHVVRVVVVVIHRREPRGSLIHRERSAPLDAARGRRARSTASTAPSTASATMMSPMQNDQAVLPRFRPPACLLARASPPATSGVRSSSRITSRPKPACELGRRGSRASRQVPAGNAVSHGVEMPTFWVFQNRATADFPTVLPEGFIIAVPLGGHT